MGRKSLENNENKKKLLGSQRKGLKIYKRKMREEKLIGLVILNWNILWGLFCDEINFKAN